MWATWFPTIIKLYTQTNKMPDIKHDKFNHKENKYPTDAVTYSINELFS